MVHAGGGDKRGGPRRPRRGSQGGAARRMTPLAKVFGVLLAVAAGTVVLGTFRLGEHPAGERTRPGGQPVGLPATRNFVPAVRHRGAGGDSGGGRRGGAVDAGGPVGPAGEMNLSREEAQPEGSAGGAGGGPAPARGEAVGGAASASAGEAASSSAAPRDGIPDKYHVVLSSGGGGRALWQDEVCYYWYQRAKKAYPDSAMGGFTRLLHASQDDELSLRIPTVRVDPAVLDATNVKKYPPLSRPLAFKMLMEMEDNGIEEDYIMMIENDHFFLKPVPNWATPTRPAAYPFHYMVFDDKVDLFKKYNKRSRPVDPKNLYPTGSSPTIMHKRQLKEISQLWPQLTAEMFRDEVARQQLGWVLEMYTFVFAAAMAKSGPINFTLRPDFMLEPPWDKGFTVNRCVSDEAPPCPKREAHIIHYSFALDFDKNGEVVPGTSGWVGRTAFRYSTKKSARLPYINLSALPPLLSEKQPLSWRLFEMLEEATRKLRSGEAWLKAGRHRVGGRETSVGKSYHVVVAATGDPASQWQTQVCYYWYLQARASHPDSALGGFTRLLHSNSDDMLSRRIHTVRVGTENSLKHQALKNDPTLARPLAFKMFMQMNKGIDEDYILMLQPDHIILKPIPNWASPTRPVAFPLFDMDFSQHRGLAEKYTRGRVPADKLPNIGSSPSIIHKDQLREISHVWADLTVELWNDKDAKKAWGHKLEAYSFALASTLVGSAPIEFSLRGDFMLQPPYDRALDVEHCEPGERRPCRRREGHIIQYSGQFDFDSEGDSTPSMEPVPGKTAWHFDKRLHSSGPPHLDLRQLPPALKENHPASWRFFEMMDEGVRSLGSPAKKIHGQ